MPLLYSALLINLLSFDEFCFWTCHLFVGQIAPGDYGIIFLFCLQGAFDDLNFNLERKEISQTTLTINSCLLMLDILPGQ